MSGNLKSFDHRYTSDLYSCAIVGKDDVVPNADTLDLYNLQVTLTDSRLFILHQIVRTPYLRMATREERVPATNHAFAAAIGTYIADVKAIIRFKLKVH